MDPKPRIVTLTEKKVIGKRLRMSLSENRTGELWRNFMPKRNIITNRLSKDHISMQIYDESQTVSDFDKKFDKWAAVEVLDFENVPDKMEAFIIEGGLYAVFDYKGLSTDNRIFKYIFETWLPGSRFQLDNRPHFEILGDSYRNEDPNSEEEIWIPIIPIE